MKTKILFTLVCICSLNKLAGQDFVYYMESKKRAARIAALYIKRGNVVDRIRAKAQTAFVADEIDLEEKNRNSYKYKNPKEKIRHIYPDAQHPCKASRNFLAINLIPLLYEALALNYEYMFFNKHFGFKVNGLYGNPNKPPENYHSYKPIQTIAAAGCDLNFYLCLRKHRCDRVQVYFGPAFEYGTFYYGYSGYEVNRYEPQLQNHMGYKATVLLKSNVSIRILKPLYINFSIAYGGIYFNENYKYPDPKYYIVNQLETPKQPHTKNPYKNVVTLRLEINLGIKF